MEPNSEKDEREKIVNLLLNFSSGELDKVKSLRDGLESAEHQELYEQLIFRNLERQIDLEVYLEFICHKSMKQFNSLPKLQNQHCFKIAESCPELTTIDLTGSNGLTDAPIVALFQKCPNLIDVSLVRSQITDDGLMEAIRENSKLEKLNLRHCKLITDESVKILAERCPNLNQLFLGWTNITNKSLRELAKRTIKIELENCTGCTWIKCSAQFLSSEMESKIDKKFLQEFLDH